MYVFVTLLFAFSSFALSAETFTAHGVPGSTQGKRSYPTTDGLSCSQFKWISADNSSKAGMLVPISLNGKLYWYQLDTGADVVTPYGPSMPKGWSRQDEGVRIPNVRFAGRSWSSILAYPMKNIPEVPPHHGPQGTVGLELLIGRAFVIDFPKQRVCLMERGDLPENLWRAVDWSRAEIRHGKLFMDVNLNGKKLDGIFFDTGASSEALDVDFDMWKKETGKSGFEDTAAHSGGKSWGREVADVEAPAIGDLKIGNHIYKKPKLTTEPARPDTFRKEYWGQGLLGNALFTDSIIILDLGAHPQFGILDSGDKRRLKTDN